VTTISRTKIAWPAFAWITWRQHRTSIVLATVLTVALSVLIVLKAGQVPFIWDAPVDWVKYVTTASSALIATFWAAPLLSREYEHRTHLVAWGQDVSPGRWLAGKAVLLAALTVVLTTILSLAAFALVKIVATRPGNTATFEANLFLQIAYALYGFGLGLACSALFRHTIAAMALTVIGFIGTRGFLAVFVRPYYIPPTHSFRPWDPPGVQYVPQVPPDGWRLDSGYADAAGNPVALPTDISVQCARTGSSQAQVECLKSNGVDGHFAIYHPLDRLPALQLIEFGIYAVLAAGLFAFAFLWVKRRKRI
jgi:hypothetical protein